MKNLRIKFKEKGRSYAYQGQDLRNSVWYIVDEDGKEYADKEAYDKANKPKPKPKAKPKAKPKVEETTTE